MVMVHYHYHYILTIMKHLNVQCLIIIKTINNFLFAKITSKNEIGRPNECFLYIRLDFILLTGNIKFNRPTFTTLRIVVSSFVAIFIEVFSCIIIVEKAMLEDQLF
jgi:hypothetical protein